jgi:hypothetical protein
LPGIADRRPPLPEHFFSQMFRAWPWECLAPVRFPRYRKIASSAPPTSLPQGGSLPFRNQFPADGGRTAFHAENRSQL